MPMMPNATVHSSTIHTKRLPRSAQSNVLTIIASRISTPPIVGVPALGR